VNDKVGKNVNVFEAKSRTLEAKAFTFKTQDFICLSSPILKDKAYEMMVENFQQIANCLTSLPLQSAPFVNYFQQAEGRLSAVNLCPFVGVDLNL